MSRMKSAYLLALAGMMMAGAGGSETPPRFYKQPLTDDEKKAAKERQNIAKGLKKFIIHGKVIWALNEKNALKKYSKTKTTTP